MSLQSYQQSFVSTFKVVDPYTKLPVTGLVDGDFSRNVCFDGATDSLTITIAEINSSTRPGVYSVTATWNKNGNWYINVFISSLFFEWEKDIQVNMAGILARATVGATTTTTTVYSNLGDANDFWNLGALIRFTSGSYAGQVRKVTDFANTNGVVTFSPALGGAPSAGDTFVLIPADSYVDASVASSGGSAPSAATVAAAVWNEATSGHTTAGTYGKLVNDNVNATISSRAVPGDNMGTVSSVTGNVGGNVVGSVASVVGAVGSVTGAVGSVTGNVGGNVVGSVASVSGNVGGNVVGTVASVVGNVGGNVVGSVASVVGAVGSVTGNVGGNVTGSVGSVVGAVGSVTGNVGGNVTGTVGSVVGNVGGNVSGSVASIASGGITTGSFAAGAVNSTVAPNLDAAITSRLAAADYYTRRNTATAGGATTITLDASASAVDDYYTGQAITIVSGVGAGQVRRVNGYVGSTKVATVDAWGTNPDNTSVFVLAEYTAAGASLTLAGIQATVWNASRASYTTSGTFGEGAASVQGNVTGSVGSVAGNVSGSVASVVGNVGGSVASVVGAVGSVTGNVGGNVTGSVGSVAGNVSGSVASVVGNVGGTVASVVGNLGGNVVGNVNGNVVGSVGSVVGAVGSVTGSVGSVTGNVGGNVVGTVASVVGNVGGNVTGSVGSVASGGITAASIATDAIGAAELASGAADKIADAFLDRATAIDGLTPRELYKVQLAALAGITIENELLTPKFKSQDGTKNRISSTINAITRNRDVVTLDVS